MMAQWLSAIRAVQLKNKKRLGDPAEANVNVDTRIENYIHMYNNLR